MPRPPRCDGPSTLHHVTNRAHAHRPLFDTKADVRVFLSLLARAVRQGLLEVHAYCVLSTHFHLLVGSRDGTLARGLGWVEDLYARYYNRTRERDGHVFKGRYFARRVDDLLYLAMVIAYIDRNPVAAGIVDHPGAYPYGSARHYLDSAPCLWLRRDRVESIVCRIARVSTYAPSAYAALWRACAPLGGDALISAAVLQPRVPVAPIARLMCAGPLWVQRWLQRCARNEEGPRATALVLGVSQFVEVERRLPDSVMCTFPDGRLVDMRRPLEAGLLRSVAGLGTEEIARRLSVSRGLVSRWLSWHREALACDVSYGMLAAGVLEGALRSVYGNFLPAGDSLGAFDAAPDQDPRPSSDDTE